MHAKTAYYMHVKHVHAKSISAYQFLSTIYTHFHETGLRFNMHRKSIAATEKALS